MPRPIVFPPGKISLGALFEVHPKEPEEERGQRPGRGVPRELEKERRKPRDVTEGSRSEHLLSECRPQQPPSLPSNSSKSVTQTRRSLEANKTLSQSGSLLNHHLTSAPPPTDDSHSPRVRKTAPSISTSCLAAARALLAPRMGVVVELRRGRQEEDALAPGIGGGESCEREDVGRWLSTGVWFGGLCGGDIMMSFWGGGSVGPFRTHSSQLHA